jgi:plastocyanin
VTPRYRPGVSTTVRSRRAVAALALGAAVAVLATALATATAAGAATAAVDVVDFAYRPAEVTVRVGDRVTWRWAGDQPHSVTATGTFDSHPDCTALTTEACGQSGDRFSWTAETPGTVSYRCRIHPERMQGTVTVLAPDDRGSTAPPPSPPDGGPGPQPSSSPQPPPSPSSRPSPEPAPSPTAPRPTSAAAPPAGDASPAGATPPATSGGEAPPPDVALDPAPGPDDPAPTVADATPGPSASEGPALEEFPEPLVTPHDDDLAADGVEVDVPGGGGPAPAKVVAGVAFGVTLAAVTRFVLLAPPW